jgi:Transglycosylase SLT domain
MVRISPTVRVALAFAALITATALPNLVPGTRVQGGSHVFVSSLFTHFTLAPPEESKPFDKVRYLRVFEGQPLPKEDFLRTIDHITRTAALEYQLDPNLIRAVIFVESTFRSHVRSHAGAKGLMQLTDLTARHLGILNSLDPHDNIKGGARYLRVLLNQFKGDIKLALAAYNAGPTNVRRYKGIPPFQETRRYITKVLHAYKKLQGA